MGAEMKPFTLATVMFLGLTACRETKEQPKAPASDMTVIYVGFDFEPFAGYGLEDLEREGCHFKMSEATLASTILKPAAGPDFRSGDVKAEIFTPGRDRMLVDSNGVLKNGLEYSLIDRTQFERALIPTGKCPVR